MIQALNFTSIVIVGLRKKIKDNAQIYLSWISILAFLRISTNIKACSTPLTLEKSFNLLNQWLDLPCVSILEPTENYLKIFHKLAITSHAKGPLIMDAQLAALALDHGVTICSFDKDFLRFETVKTINPLNEEVD